MHTLLFSPRTSPRCGSDGPSIVLARAAFPLGASRPDRGHARLRVADDWPTAQPIGNAASSAAMSAVERHARRLEIAFDLSGGPCRRAG